MSSVAEDLETLRGADAALLGAGPTPFPLPVTGLEAVVVGAQRGLRRSDWWVPGLRERVGAVLRGVPLERLVDGLSGARPYRVAPPTTSPATRALHAVGLALAAPDRAVLVHLGVGSAADGAFHEALNLAALTGARVIFLVAVMQLEGAPVGAQLAGSVMSLGAAHGIRTTEVDGRDVAAITAAVTEARNADGPTVISAQLGAVASEQLGAFAEA